MFGVRFVEALCTVAVLGALIRLSCWIAGDRASTISFSSTYAYAVGFSGIIFGGFGMLLYVVYKILELPYLKTMIESTIPYICASMFGASLQLIRLTPARAIVSLIFISLLFSVGFAALVVIHLRLASYFQIPDVHP
jgi:hypothetical protein